VPRPPPGTIFHPSTEWVRRHDVFHDALVAACGSRWLIEFCGHLRDQAYRYRKTTSEERVDASLKEHAAIMKAALDRDADAAVSLLVAHFRATAEITLRRYRNSDAKRE
jgi:DNA-binding GntR family transcriptional regulator